MTYRGFRIERHHSGPWDVTYEWAKCGWDLGDPMGYEPSIQSCKQSIDEQLECDCIACGDTKLVKVDPFDSVADAPCPDCREA